MQAVVILETARTAPDRPAAENNVRHTAVDYRIRQKPEELDSTGYIEIGPGKYSGKHWQDGFLFVWGDAFGMAEGIITRHFPDYDHFAMNDIPKHSGRQITAEWRDAATRLHQMDPEQSHAALNLHASYPLDLDKEMGSHKSEIATMLRSLAQECDEFYREEDWICILGM